MVLLLTAGIMVIALFLLARLAKRAGIRIAGRALALAECFAIAIALGIPFVAPFLTEGYYVKLAAMTIGAAVLVTAYNAYLCKKEPEAESESDADARETLADRMRAAIGPDHFKWERPRKEPVPEPVEDVAPALADEPQSDEKPAPPATPAPVKEPPKIELPGPGPAPETMDEPEVVEEASEPISIENAEPSLTGEPPSPRGGGPRERWGVSPARQEDKHAEISAGATKNEKPAELPEPEAVDAVPEPDPFDAITAEITELQTLDDFLDYADAAQKRGDLSRATTAYANAVDRFVDDPYIIYLYMDLGNLLKQQARYADCINVYHAALSIPILAENPAIAREFEHGIRFLGIVQAVLRHHHAEDTPFGDIPDAIRAEIEATEQALAKKSASKGEQP